MATTLTLAPRRRLGERSLRGSDGGVRPSDVEVAAAAAAAARIEASMWMVTGRGREPWAPPPAAADWRILAGDTYGLVRRWMRCLGGSGGGSLLGGSGGGSDAGDCGSDDDAADSDADDDVISDAAAAAAASASFHCASTWLLLRRTGEARTWW